MHSFEYVALQAFFLPSLSGIISLLLRHFNDTPVAVYNCDSVEVVGSEFLNNTAHGTLVDLPFRTNAGGIAYSSNNQPKSVNPSLWITGCVFANNSALQTVSQDPSQSRQLSLYTGRGGGIGAALGVVENVDILVENCTFTGNRASVFGGGLYIFTESNATHHHYSVVNCTFLENSAILAGGGVGFSFFAVGAHDTTNRIELRQATFVRNRAEDIGGAVYLFPGMLFCVGCL